MRVTNTVTAAWYRVAMRGPIVDIVFLLGLVLLSVGCWMVYTPLGLIVPGGVLLCVAVLASRADDTPRGQVNDGP